MGRVAIAYWAAHQAMQMPRCWVELPGPALDPCGRRALLLATTLDALTGGSPLHRVQRMLRFADGFVRLRQQNGQLWLTDLRMGQEGAYVFDFDLGPLAPQTQATRAVQHSQRAPIGKSLRWLWARMWGADLPALSAQDLRGGGN
ncbi:MAG: hypothetical protein IPN06_13355 [Burkholderiales bacterium]|nr:hypothetical protein [Burkholderiales bacterium]